nr:peptidylprolyl isomerase [uncultured Oscillibacter sp.]
MKKRLYAVVFMACIALLLGTGCSGKQPDGMAGLENGDEPPASEGVPAGEGAEEGPYTAVVEIDGYGTVTLELDAAAAPVTTENFVSLARAGFYDGLTFHRIIEGFMVQGGDPNGNGTGGSGQTIQGEFEENGVENNLSHTRGAVSMARSQDYDSASSQFFIVHEDSTFLDGSYAAFGYVTEGMEVIDAICADAEPMDGNGSIAPENQPVIRSITIP